MRKEIVFYLNGAKHRVGNEHAGLMLSDYLRYEKCLTGTKVVCAEGDCGACSVLKYSPIQSDSKTYLSFNSCVTPVATLDGSSIITVDALSEKESLHEAQRAMVDCHGSQCGFCTPGFVMALAGLVDEKLEKSENKMDEQEAKNFMTGNLCRCTGYDAIIDSALNIDLSKCERLEQRFYSTEQDKDLNKVIDESVLIETADYRFFAPITIEEACLYKEAHPDVVIIASSTDLGVVHNKRRTKLVNLLSLHLIKDLYKISDDEKRIKIGSRVTMHDLRDFIKGGNEEFATYLDIFASPQIKNIATIAGNIATASPIGDTAPVLLSLDATLHLVSKNGRRDVPMSEFFLDYRKTELKADEIIEAISFLKIDGDFIKSYKSSNRKDLDISTVNLSLFVGKDKSDIRIAAGGIAATPLRLKATEEHLKKNEINAKTINEAIVILHTEFKPLTDVRGSSAYRHMLVENYFKRAMSEYLEVSRD